MNDYPSFLPWDLTSFSVPFLCKSSSLCDPGAEGRDRSGVLLNQLTSMVPKYPPIIVTLDLVVLPFERAELRLYYKVGKKSEKIKVEPWLGRKLTRCSNI